MINKGSGVGVVAWCLVAVVVVLVVEVQEMDAVTCSTSQLSSCAGAIFISGTPPSATCCKKLKEQEPCFCGYLNDPAYKPYITSGNIKKVAATCGVTIPDPASC